MAFPVAAAVGALGAIGSSVLGNSGTRSNMRLQAQLNKEQMKYQDELNRSYQKMLWNNQYSAQMSGMKNAGMNPAFDGASPSMQASNSVGSGASGPSAPTPDITGGAISAMNAEKDMTLKDKQAELLDAQTQKTLNEADKTKNESEFIAFQNTPEYKRARLSGAENESLKAFWDASKSKSEIPVNEARVANLAKQTDKIAAEIGLIGEQKKNFVAQTAKLWKEVRLIEEQRNTEISKQEWYRATSRAANAAATLDEQRSDPKSNLPWAEFNEKYEHALSMQSARKGQDLSNEYQSVANEIELTLKAYFAEVKTKYNLDARAYWEIIGHIMHNLSPVSDLNPVDK